jgi:hypothetical protein
MLPSLMYLVVRMLLRVPVPNGLGEAAKDLEIVVLRHELSVLTSVHRMAVAGRALSARSPRPGG